MKVVLFVLLAASAQVCPVVARLNAILEFSAGESFSFPLCSSASASQVCRQVRPNLIESPELSWQTFVEWVSSSGFFSKERHLLEEVLRERDDLCSSSQDELLALDEQNRRNERFQGFKNTAIEWMKPVDTLWRELGALLPLGDISFFVWSFFERVREFYLGFNEVSLREVEDLNYEIQKLSGRYLDFGTSSGKATEACKPLDFKMFHPEEDIFYKIISWCSGKWISRRESDQIRVRVLERSQMCSQRFRDLNRQEFQNRVTLTLERVSERGRNLVLYFCDAVIELSNMMGKLKGCFDSSRHCCEKLRPVLV